MHVLYKSLGLTEGEDGTAGSLADGVGLSLCGSLNAVEEGGEDLARRGETTVGHEEDVHEVVTKLAGGCQLLEELLHGRSGNLCVCVCVHVGKGDG